jgi:hypothetical protein
MLHPASYRSLEPGGSLLYPINVIHGFSAQDFSEIILPSGSLIHLLL